MGEAEEYGEDETGRLIPIKDIDREKGPCVPAQIAHPEDVLGCPDHLVALGGEHTNLDPAKTTVESPPGCIVGPIYSNFPT